MSETTKSVKSVVVISDARNEEILSIFRTLHGKVLTALQECDITAQFKDNFAKCGAEDLKNLHQQSRALLNAHKTSKWEARIGSVRNGIQSVIDTHMVAQRAAKSQLDALRLTMGDAGSMLPAFPAAFSIPVSDIVGCWPTNTDMSLVSKDMLDLGYTVVKGKEGAPDTFKVAFKEEKVAQVVEEASKSEEVAKAA